MTWASILIKQNGLSIRDILTDIYDLDERSEIMNTVDDLLEGNYSISLPIPSILVKIPNPLPSTLEEENDIPEDVKITYKTKRISRAKARKLSESADKGKQEWINTFESSFSKSYKETILVLESRLNRAKTTGSNEKYILSLEKKIKELKNNLSNLSKIAVSEYDKYQKVLGDYSKTKKEFSRNFSSMLDRVLLGSDFKEKQFKRISDARKQIKEGIVSTNKLIPPIKDDIAANEKALSNATSKEEKDELKEEKNRLTVKINAAEKTLAVYEKKLRALDEMVGTSKKAGSIPKHILPYLEREGEGVAKDAHFTLISAITDIKSFLRKNNSKYTEIDNLTDTLGEKFNQFLKYGSLWEQEELITTPEKSKEGKIQSRFKRKVNTSSKPKAKYLKYIKEIIEGMREEDYAKVLSNNPTLKLKMLFIAKKSSDALLEREIDGNDLVQIDEYKSNTKEYAILKEDIKSIRDLLNQKPEMFSKLLLYAEQEYGVVIPIAIKNYSKAKSVLSSYVKQGRSNSRLSKEARTASKNSEFSYNEALLIFSLKRDLVRFSKYLKNAKDQNAYNLFVKDEELDKKTDAIEMVIKRVIREQIDENSDAYNEYTKEYKVDDILTDVDSALNRQISFIEQESDLLTLVKTNSNLKELLEELSGMEDRVTNDRNSRYESIIAGIDDLREIEGREKRNLFDLIVDIEPSEFSDGKYPSLTEEQRNETIEDIDNLIELLSSTVKGADEELKKENTKIHEILETILNSIGVFNIDLSKREIIKINALCKNIYQALDEFKNILAKLPLEGGEEE